MNRVPVEIMLDHIRAVVEPDTGPGDDQLLETFAARGEEAAFCLLLRRHGRLVWSVCRRILPQAHDAEDVFQATFLVLARQAATVRKRASVGSWLHGVASRLSWQLRKRLARRTTELLADGIDSSGQPEPHKDASLREALLILDEEVARLPEKYRGPIVLCHLEGKTTEEAARELGAAVGTLRTRLVRARELLQARLRVRGVAAPAVAVTALAAEVGAAALPQELAPRTLGAVLSFVGRPGGAISTATLQLANGLLRSHLLHRLRWWALGLAAMLLLGGGATAILSTHPGETTRTDADPPEAVEKAEPGPVIAKAAKRVQDDPLPPGALARIGTQRFRHGSRVYCLSASPDGQLLASAGQDGKVRLWEVATGRELGVLTKDNKELFCAVFSPDGKSLAVGDEKIIRLWDVTARRVLWEQKQDRDQNYLAFAPDGKWLIARSGAGPTRWDTATGKPLEVGPSSRPYGPYETVPLHDGKSVITVVGERQPAKGDDILTILEVRDVATGRVLRRIDVAGIPSFPPVCFHLRHLIALSPDDTTMALPSRIEITEDKEGDAVTLYDLATGKEQRRLAIKEGEPSCLAFARDGKSIAAGDKHGNLHLWESKTGKKLHTIAAHPRAVRTIVFLPGGKGLATGDEEGIIRLWDWAGVEVRPIERGLLPIRSLAVGGNGQALFTAGDEPIVRRWDPTTGKELGQFKGIAGGASGVSCSPDGKTLAAVDCNHDIVLWNVASGTENRRWRTHPGHRASQVVFAPDGKTLASVGIGGSVCLWDPSTGKEVRWVWSGPFNDEPYRHYSPGAQRIAFSADGRLIASSNDCGEVRLGETATGNERLVIKLPGTWPTAGALAFKPDGTMLAVPCNDGRVRVYSPVPDKSNVVSPPKYLGEKATVVEVRTVKKLQELEGLGHEGLAVAFSPDGRLLATGGNGLVHLWDTATWRPRGVLRGHKGAVTSLAFLSNERLVSASADTTVLLWNVAAAR